MFAEMTVVIELVASVVVAVVAEYSEVAAL